MIAEIILYITVTIMGIAAGLSLGFLVILAWGNLREYLLIDKQRKEDEKNV